MKIVIVDDNVSMRKVLSALIEAQGHQVVDTLEDGSTLLACVKKHLPDLVCLDQNMPGQSGLELLTALQLASPDTHVVMITASSDPALEGKAADAGAFGFLHKPFSQTQILEELKHVETARLLVAKETAKPATVAQTEAHAARTAVVVDDSSSMRMLLKGILEDLKVRVVATASNGAAGVEAAKKYQPAVVCLDVAMPVMSGLEALPLIREASPNSKVVMVTGNVGKTFIEEAIASGAKGYIIKPLRPAYVEAFIKKLLS